MKKQKQSFGINAFASATAVVFGTAYLFCTLLFWIVPKATIKALNYLMHGIEFGSIVQKNITLGPTLIGLGPILILSYIGGALFAFVYNNTLKIRR